MTNGRQSGTSGRATFRLGPWAAIALLTVPVVLVNATSDLIEMQRSGLAVHMVEPFIWEITSAAVLVLMAPLVGWAVKRWPLRGPGLPLALLIHAGLSVPFSLAHVGAMVPAREAAYAVLGWPYDFFGGGIWVTLLYEWRKDLITYGIFAAVYSGYAWWAAREAAPAPDASRGPERIEVKVGGRTLFLLPGEILWLEAAGNYVTLHTAGGSHLLRATLADWEKRLSACDSVRTNPDISGQIVTSPDAKPDFVRIHRSRIVNRHHIRETRTTSSGDFELTLSNGAVLAGSRRFRSALG
ncbi:LytTR family DNA-binding domain-containing protein [Hyphomonas sp. NPDC076900]|uniref:LytTR family DNA-binding domain-containing protein n=1 Tax=unclassified Hyphomonas TaxID=2630699 RepID=UPI003CFE64DD